MTIIYKSRWKSVALWALVSLVVLVLAGARVWYGLDDDDPMPAPSASAPGVWGTGDAAYSGPAQESPFDSSARGILPGDVTGRWVGAIELGAGTRLPFSFDLRVANGALSGTARFPIGDAGIEDGKVVGTLVSFTTRHVIASSQRVLITQFAGELAEGALQLTMRSEGAESHLTLNRNPG